MKNKNSVYQSEIWKSLRASKSEKSMQEPFFTYSKTKNFPFIGKKKILFSEGTHYYKDKDELITKLKSCSCCIVEEITLLQKIRLNLLRYSDCCSKLS